MKEGKISVFTATYNRADKIHRVYNSLIRQSYQNFEWIIVDDGSGDNIEEVVNKFIDEQRFEIKFHRFSRNRGKHFAINKCLDLADADFIIVGDSDDELLDDCLSTFIRLWNSISVHEQHNYSGVLCCCIDQYGNRISDTLLKDPTDASMADLYFKYKFRKEALLMVKLEEHRKKYFPETYEKVYYAEGIIWRKISQSKILRASNVVVRRYYINEGISLMSQKTDVRKKIKRHLIGSKDILTSYSKYFFDDIATFIKSFILFSIGIIDDPKELIAIKYNFVLVFFFIALLPITFLLYLLYIAYYKFK